MSATTNLLPANTSGIETNTSGWTAGANTTLSQSSRFYQGAKSLGMQRTGSSGAASATTAARVAVTAGEQYTAYAYFANVVAVSGRTATVRVDWWAASSGGTAISSDASAAATLANSTAWNTPPPIVVATAPAGAQYASVTLTVSGMSASETVAVDVITLGPPNAIVGNLLDYNTQGLEVSAAGWQALTNCTVSRTSSVPFEGWWSLQITATTAGDASARTVASYPVIPGTEYMAYAWTYAPASGVEFRVEMWWYDDTGTLIPGSQASQPWFPDASTWTRCAVIGKAPPGAVTGRTVLRPQAASGGQAWLFDQIAFMPSPLLAGNMIGYNAQDFEVSVSEWTAREGCSIERTLERAANGVASMKVVCTGTGHAIVDLVDGIPVTPGLSYKLSPTIYHTTMPAGPVVDLLFSWLDVDGVEIGSTFYRWTMGQAAGWNAPVGSAVAPNGAATLKVGLRLRDPDATTVYNVDLVYLGLGGLAAIPTELEGAYGARITLRGLTTSGATNWGLWRMLPDGSMTPIRGDTGDLEDEMVSGDIAIVEDYEAPLGTPVTYRVKTWAGSTSLSYSAPPITLAEPTDSLVVMKDPGVPVRNCTAVAQTLPNWSRSARQGKHTVRGRRRPVVLTDIRSAKEGTLTVVTETDEEREALEWLTDTGNTLLLQWPSGWGLQDMYVQIGDVTESRISEYAGHPDRSWDLPLTEVDRPIGGIVGSTGRTWQTVLDESLTWADVFESADSWLDVYTGVRGS